MPSLRRNSDLKNLMILLLLLTPLLLSHPDARAYLRPADPQPAASQPALAPPTAKVDPWPQAPPQIGRLVLKQEYWNYMKEAAQKYRLSPYLIQAVCAIESRYDPYASSGRGQCYGLMQLHRDTARKYGVNSQNPRENILGGAAVLANLLTKYNGDLSRVLHVYNATCTAAYEREVLKAFVQATTQGEATLRLARLRSGESALRLARNRY
jgi:soluble lytic murein transglycosylase-like protein